MSAPKEQKSYFEKVYEVTNKIPRGRVTNYGAIAEFLSLGSARMVGWALNHSHGLEIPAHRVVNRLGELSGRIMFASPTLMQERLESEGIKVEDDKVVDFKKLFWHPKEQYELTPIEETDTTTYISHSVLDLNVIAEKILEEAKNRNISVLTFYGDLGAGKTTLIKAMTKTLGIDEANSPTFSLINEYLDKNGAKVYHMDLYRLESVEEAMDIGIEDYLFSGNLVMIEWPQVIETLLEDHLKIAISRRGDGSRIVSLSI